MQHHVPVFDRTIQKSREWLHEITSQFDNMDDHHAYALLRATLQTLRDRLSIDEAAQFSAQLPLLLKGTFFEGWNPSTDSSRIKTREEFIENVSANLALTTQFNLDLEQAIRATLQVIRQHISPGEMADVIGTLPKDIKQFFNEV